MVNSDNDIDEKTDDAIYENRTSVNSQFQRMMRGQSFENECGCDEIMQQFINGLESFIEQPEEACQTN